MASNALTEPFHFCFSALCDELKKWNREFLTNDDCLIEDTREADFTKIENRLAYMYKFGYINSVLVEKCTLSFFDQYFQGDKNYFSGNLKICSLSNGPGIDIVGFLCALYKSNKLKFSPLVQAINLYDLWKDTFHNLICSVYLEHNSKFNETCSAIPPENIQFIQCDIFSSLSPPAQNVINTCDILLMVKVFNSPKAPQIITERLQEIFSLLRSGALVFFFGSKKNIKEIMKDHMTKYVNYLFGPILMDLEENIPDKSPLKPKVCSKVKFIVLQKKDDSEDIGETSLQNVTKCASSSTVLSPDISVVNDSVEESDTESERSSTCSSKPSDIFCIPSQYLSHENRVQFVTSQSLNNAIYADEKKLSLDFPVKSTSLFETMLSLEQINTEPVSSMIDKDTISKENLTEGFTFSEFMSQKENPDKNGKQTCQLEDLNEVQSPDFSGEVKSIAVQEKDITEETNTDSSQNDAKNENKLSLNLPTERTLLSQSTFLFDKINSEQVSNVAKKDKENLTEGFTLTDLPEIDKFISHEGIAERNVSNGSKQSSQLEVLSPDLSDEVRSVISQETDVAKEDTDSSQSASENEKSRLRQQKKHKNTVDESNSNEFSVQLTTFIDSEERTDTDSESSLTSSNKQSTLSIKSQHLMQENKFQSMASQSVNEFSNLPTESTSLSENTFLFNKINSELSNVAKKDTISKENLTEGFTLIDLPKLDKFVSHEGVAERNVSSSNKQSSELEDFDEAQSLDLSGEVKSTILQEKDDAKETDADSSQNITKKNDQSKQKKSKITPIAPSSHQCFPNMTAAFSGLEEENYTNSESSHTSSSKQSDEPFIQSLYLSNEYKFLSMASQNVNNTNCADEKKQILNLPIESSSLHEVTRPFEKINAEPANSMTKTDTVNKERLSPGLPANRLPVVHKFLSHQAVAENVSTDSKQLNQLVGLGKVQSVVGARSVTMGLTSKKKLARTGTIPSKQVLPSHNLLHADLFESANMAACKETGMQDASNDRSILNEISRKEGWPSQMNCSSYNGAERYAESSNPVKQSKLTSPKQFQLESKNTVSGQFVGVRSNDDLHSMLQRCENVVTLLERVVDGISTDMQSFQNSQVPMEECCSGYVCCASRNLHCCTHCDNLSVQSHGRKNCCCMRAQTNVNVEHSNCACCTERVNDTHLCHSGTNPKPYFAVPVQNEHLSHILSFISKKA